MHNNVRAMFNRTNQIRSSKSIVNNQRKSVLVRNFCNSVNVWNVRIRISQSFNINSFCVRLNRIFKLRKIVRVNKSCCYSI